MSTHINRPPPPNSEAWPPATEDDFTISRPHVHYDRCVFIPGGEAIYTHPGHAPASSSIGHPTPASAEEKPKCGARDGSSPRVCDLPPHPDTLYHSDSRLPWNATDEQIQAFGAIRKASAPQSPPAARDDKCRLCGQWVCGQRCTETSSGAHYPINSDQSAPLAPAKPTEEWALHDACQTPWKFHTQSIDIETSQRRVMCPSLMSDPAQGPTGGKL